MWQAELAERLKAAGHDVAFRPVDGPFSADPLSIPGKIERRLYRLGLDSPSGIAADALAAFGSPHEPPDLTIDALGVSQRGSGVCMTLLCDGQAGQGAAFASLLRGRPPVLTVELTEAEGSARQIGVAVPGLEEPHILTRSFDRVCERSGDLLFNCVRDVAEGTLKQQPAPTQTPSATPGLAAGLIFTGLKFADRMARRLAKPLIVDEHWRLGWRRTNGDGIDQTLSLPSGGFTFLPDDATRFFADPFVLWRDGVAHILCEEFPYATRKGVISHVSLDAEGRPSQPRVVLERPYHLSYPFLFERDGEVFMIPETSANSTVELYRADPFPHVWKLERVLIEDVRLGDATLLERDGLFWLFGTITDGRRSTWDALAIFFAEKLEGPWRPHPANPVLIDAGCARPAGAFFEQGGTLYRPAQDCRDGYGAQLAICRVDRLDTQNYEQTVVHRLAPPDAWGGKAFHTLNRSGPIEVVDTKGWRRKF